MDAWRVLYAPAGAQLARRPQPAGLREAACLGECAVECSSALSLPPWDSPLLADLKLSRDETDQLLGLRYAFDASYGQGPVHQMAGHPRAIQGDMAYALPDEGQPWVLLFQLDSDDAADVMWGDGGRLYFWITASELQKLQFDRVRLVFQCG